MRNILFILGLVISVAAYSQTDTIQNNDSGLATRQKLNEDILKGNDHADTIPVLRTDINTNVDTLEIIRSDVNTNKGTGTDNAADISTNSDSITAIRSDVNTNVDTLGIIRSDVNTNVDTLGIIRSDVNTNKGTGTDNAASISDNSDSITAIRSDVDTNTATGATNSNDISVVDTKYSGVTGFAVDSITSDSNKDTLYVTYNGEALKLVLYGYKEIIVPPTDPPTVHPISHNQKYIIHDDMNNSDYVGEVYTNWTDTIFGNRTDANYAFSILSGNTGSAFAINATSGLITVNDYTAIGADFNLTVRVAHTDDADTINCHLNYRTSPVFIDWGWTGTESGTRSQPYNSYTSDIGTGVAGTTYLFNRGESSNGDRIYASNHGDTIFYAAYGAGARPVFNNLTSRGILFGSCFNWNEDDSVSFPYGKNLHAYDFDIQDGGQDENATVEITDNSYACELHRLKIEGQDGNGVLYVNPKKNHVTGKMHPSRHAFRDIEIIQNDPDDVWSDNSTGAKITAGYFEMTNVKVSTADAGYNDEAYGIRITGMGHDTIRHIHISGNNGMRGGLQIRNDSSLFEWGYIDSAIYYGIYCQETDGVYYTDDFSISGSTVRNFWLNENSTVNSASVWASIGIDKDVGNLNATDYPRNMTFENILITDSGSGGVELNNRGGSSPPTNMTFTNLIVVDGQDSGPYDGDGILIPSGAVNTVINNSIFYNLEGVSLKNNATGIGTARNNMYEDYSGAFSVFTNNYDIDDGNPFVGGGDYTTADGPYKNDIVDSGVNISQVLDMLGNPIDIQDIGPFEYGGVVFNWTDR